MGIGRTARIDSDGSPGSGTPIDNAEKQQFYDQIDAHIGDWTTVAYAAGNFTASGAMTWGVDSGDQVTFKYRYLNKTLDVVFYINDSDVGGTANSELRIAVPGGFVPTNVLVPGTLFFSDAGGSFRPSICYVTLGSAFITCTKGDGTNWTLTTGDNTVVSGHISFQVN